MYVHSTKLSERSCPDDDDESTRSLSQLITKIQSSRKGAAINLCRFQKRSPHQLLTACHLLAWCGEAFQNQHVLRARQARRRVDFEVPGEDVEQPPVAREQRETTRAVNSVLVKHDHVRRCWDAEE